MITADKSLGQHFLKDKNILENIYRSMVKLIKNSNSEKKINIFEIGPGPAALTKQIIRLMDEELKESNIRFIMIEKDYRMINNLKELTKNHRNISIIHGDAMKQNLSELVKDFAASENYIFANLPYNVGTRMYYDWLLYPNNFSGMLLMFQKEVAEKIMAIPGTKLYGKLSIISSLAYKIKQDMIVKPGSFSPPPKVDSSVISLIPKEHNFSPEKIKQIADFCDIIFSSRRKTIRNNLRNSNYIISDALLEKYGQYRAEDLQLEQILEMICK